jgi:hypothetical protein
LFTTPFCACHHRCTRPERFLHGTMSPSKASGSATATDTSYHQPYSNNKRLLTTNGTHPRKEYFKTLNDTKAVTGQEDVQPNETIEKRERVAPPLIVSSSSSTSFSDPRSSKHIRPFAKRGRGDWHTRGFPSKSGPNPGSSIRGSFTSRGAAPLPPLPARGRPRNRGQGTGPHNSQPRHTLNPILATGSNSDANGNAFRDRGWPRRNPVNRNVIGKVKKPSAAAAASLAVSLNKNLIAAASSSVSFLLSSERTSLSNLSRQLANFDLSADATGGVVHSFL